MGAGAGRDVERRSRGGVSVQFMKLPFFGGIRSCLLGSFFAAAKQRKGKDGNLPDCWWWTPLPLGGHLHPHK